MKKQIYTSIVLVLLALAAVTAATVAWFSIADNTRVRTMSLDIVTDVDMRMDLDPLHAREAGACGDGFLKHFAGGSRRV